MKNQNLVIPIIGLIILVILSSGVVAELIENRIFSLFLRYDKGDIMLVNITLKYGFAPDRKIQPESGYTTELISLKNVTLYSFKFNIPNEFLQVPPLEGHLTEDSKPLILEHVNFALITPYFTEAGYINIYDPNNKLLLSVDVSQYSQTTDNTNTLQVSSLLIVLILLIIFGMVFGVHKLSRRKYHKRNSKNLEQGVSKPKSKEELKKQLEELGLTGKL